MLIDANLNFKQHVDKLLVKISKRIGVLGRIRNNLTVDAANKVYQSLVLPVMDYCDVAWSSIGKIERDKLDRAQRRVARIVLKTKDSDAEKNLKWLPLSMRRDMHTINLTFKCLKGSPSVFFKDYFKVETIKFSVQTEFYVDLSALIFGLTEFSFKKNACHCSSPIAAQNDSDDNLI